MRRKEMEMSRLLEPLVRWRFVRFLLVGLLNTGVGLSVIYLAKWLLAMGDASANLLGYSVGLIVSFSVNRRWTFDHDGPLLRGFAKFVLVIATAYAVNLITVLGAIEVWQLNGYLAQPLGIVPYTLLSYLGLKLFVFRDQRERKEP